VSLAPGARLGPYEILGAIGAGAMGEVYRARDGRLGRDVAIKVLPADFSADPERLRRFEQEARAAAALNHPNILAVHDIGHHDNSPYIVSELLEGETLRAQLAKRARPGDTSAGHSVDIGHAGSSSGTGLPVRKVIDYAIQIAHGLAAAHDQGISHRDLKPENVVIATDGHVKILDFGLAKLTQAEPARAVASTLPTTPAIGTNPGMILGTMGYMAPEQLRGQTVDHRADIFAFGAVLYEMLSGERAFHGATTADTISAILEKDPPDLLLAERHIPPGLARIVDRCLEKSAAARFKSADDLAFALEGLSSSASSSELTSSVRRPRARRIERALAAIAAVTTAAAAALGILYVRSTRTTEAPLMRLDITTPPTSDPTSMAISPDGRHIVFTATANGKTQLWLRALDSATTQLLAGTEGATAPFWSPDSRAVGFVADARLKRVDLSGGPPQSLTAAANVTVVSAGSWNRDGVILFPPNLGVGAGIWRIASNGGEPVAVTHPDERHTSHAAPQFLPDGRHFLYTASAGTQPGVYLAALDTPEEHRLLVATTGIYASPGYLLFVRQGTLFAQPFDLTKLALEGDPVQVGQQVVAGNPSSSFVAVSASATGLLAYRAVASTSQSLFAWFDRSGEVIDRIDTLDVAQASDPHLSPVGKQLAFDRTVDGNRDVWVYELTRRVATRFTVDAAPDEVPVWSPDSDRIVFASTRGKSLFNLYQKLASGGSSEELALETPLSKFPQDWSPDGRFLLFRAVDPKTARDLWALPLQGDRKPFPVANTQFEEREGQFSPDGRWVAYASNASGRYEVYAQPFPRPVGKWQVSTAGGNQPRWRHDGKELFYIAPDGTLVAAPIVLRSDGQAPEVGKSTALFRTSIVVGATRSSGSSHEYAVTPDGQRFLINVTTNEATTTPIPVMTNWTTALKK
jgi:serine/threonine protein kinase